GLDLHRARHLGRDPALDRHPGGVARFHDCRRRDRVMVVRQAGADEALDGLQAQHGGAGRVRGPGARLARLRVQAQTLRPDPDGLRHGLYAFVRFALSGRVGTAHEHDRSEIVTTPVAVRVQPRQLAFALTHAESLARDNFLEGPANEAGLGLIERWPEWPARTMLLV